MPTVAFHFTTGGWDFPLLSHYHLFPSAGVYHTMDVKLLWQIRRAVVRRGPTFGH